MAKQSKGLFNWSFCLSLILITIGAVMAALALELILIPNSMIDGGMNGISIILNTLFGGSLGIIIFIYFNYFKYFIWWFTWYYNFYC